MARSRRRGLGLLQGSTALFGTLGLMLAPVPLPGPAATNVVALTTRAVESGASAVVAGIKPFDMIGLSWPMSTVLATTDQGEGGHESGHASEPRARVRVRLDGHWSRWMEVEAHREEGPDLGAAEADRARWASPPIWVGGADAYQVDSDLPTQAHVVRGSSKARPGLLAALSGFGPSAAGALVARPDIQPRSAWVAREPKAEPSVGKVQMGFVHHTVGANDYSADQVPGILRSIQAYHMDANGWDDIGYNFLVDRFGRIWEGRGGGIERSVIGAHAGGFNTNGTGVAILGTFTDSPTPAAATTAVSRLLSWKLPHHGVDPASQTNVQSRGSTRYPDGTVVALQNVSGHRDVSQTSCPGGRLYERLGQIRADAAAGAAVAVPYSPAWGGGMFVAAGDLDGDSTDELVTGADSGGGPHVRTFDASGSGRESFIVYPAGFRGGVRVAAGNADAIGGDEIATAAGPGGGPHVRVLRNETEPMGSFMAYTPGFTGGVYVAMGNVDGIPGDEIITGAGAGGGPHVRVFRFDGTPMGSFFAYAPEFRGGVRVAAADVDGDGRDEIVTGAGPGGGPHVRVFDLAGRNKGSFFAYHPSFTGGVHVASMPASGEGPDAANELIVTGAGEGGGPHVRVLDGAGAEKGSFFAGRPTDKGGVRVAAGLFTPGALPEDEATAEQQSAPQPQPTIVTGAGPQAPALLKLALPNGTLIFP